MFFRRILYLSAFIYIFSYAAAAQDDDPIRVDSSLVRLNVGVVDNRGRPVTNLGVSDFAVYEDGVRQQITRFEPSTSPFSVVFILDMSGSTLGFRQVMKQSAFRFIDALAPDDRVAVIEFYDKVNLRNDFTTDRKTIANSIEVSNGRGKTQLFKAIDLALEKLSTEKSRRKAVIVLSDGVDTAARDLDREKLSSIADDKVANAIDPSQNGDLVRLLDIADKQGVTIYPLALPTGDPAKLADPTPRQVAMYKAARARLQIVADRTGGVLNTINRLEEMGTLYARVAADLRTLYTIEYEPVDLKRDGKWRTIRLDTRDPALVARTRTGYFAK